MDDQQAVTVQPVVAKVSTADELQASSSADKNNYFLNYVGRYMAAAP